jgi:protein SMG7
MQTSYQFISNYKQHVAALDRTLQSAPRHQPRQGNHGPVEYRKLMQRFRQFLAEEEKFWTQLVARYQRSFALHEAQSMLSALSIAVPDDTGAPTCAGGHESVQSPNPSRNQSQFPLEGSTPSSTSAAERETNLSILSKAIVCLGDMARYRELYNEGGGRPRAGQQDGPATGKRGGRNRRAGAPGFDAIPRARNYDKAIQCYEQARLLGPSEGNPSHQLAILAFYQSDMFSSLLHYYRALCVRQPYDTASENVKKILNKSLDQHAKKTREGQAAPEIGDLPPRLRVESFKEKVVLLHALWRLGSDK